jgi:hypothetical protein
VSDDAVSREQSGERPIVPAEARIEAEVGGDQNRADISLSGTAFGTTYSVKARLYGASATVFLLWWGEPDGKFFPLAIGAMVVSFLFAKGTSQELVDELRKEIDRRDVEIARLSEVKAEYERRWLARRGSSTDKRKGKR